MIVSVIYTLQDGQNFDIGYYLKSHIPMVQELFTPSGMTSVQVLEGTGSPAGPAPAKIIALLEFSSDDGFQDAIAKHGARVLGDIANFTQTQPSIQFNRKLA